MPTTEFDSIEATPDQEQGMKDPAPTKIEVKTEVEEKKSSVMTPVCIACGVTVALAVGVGAGVGIGAAVFTQPEAIKEATVLTGSNICHGKKPAKGAGFDNFDCFQDNVVVAAEQAGADVTAGFVGGLATTADPIVTPYYQNGLCPVNVHWHLGAEHRSAGEYDEAGHGPDSAHRRQLAERQLAATGSVRKGLQCHHYDSSDAKFTTEYNWKHCVGMHVGETYEVHWPHSAAGACGTPNQYQTPFYDGVLCSDTAVGLVLDGTIPMEKAVGVQAQVFTIVNDEDYYYPDLMRGMIVEGAFGSDIAAYTGSTTGTSRDNTICSAYSPITWQVDRKCHMISASTFDKMCADMKAQRDDMSDDLHAHGSRELVSTELTADNQGTNVANGLFRKA